MFSICLSVVLAMGLMDYAVMLSKKKNLACGLVFKIKIHPPQIHRVKFANRIFNPFTKSKYIYEKKVKNGFHSILSLEKK